MVKKYKHIIWDWNGTLWNDSWLCFEVTNKMLLERSMPALSRARYEDIMRFPIKDYYSDLGFDYSLEPYEKLANQFILEYEAHRFECKLQDNSEYILKEFSALGITQSVLSAYKQDTLVEAVNYFGLAEYFNDIIGLNDIYAVSKVDNGINYINSSSYQKHEVLFIGDTTHDYDVSQAMGIDCILIESGHNSRSRLEQCSVPVISQLKELLTWF